jgi:hypothetical protein
MDFSLDNKYTQLYKEVGRLQAPARYIISVDDEYHSFEEVVKYNPEASLEEIIETFIDTVANRSSIIYAYFYFSLSTKNETDLMNEINEYLDKINNADRVENPNFVKFDLFTSINELKLAVKEWKIAYVQEFKRDKANGEKIVRIQKEMKSIAPLEFSNLMEKSARYELIPIINPESEKNKRQRNIDVNEKVGIIIFNDSKVSNEVPLIKLCNYDKKDYFKVYESDTFQNINKLLNNPKFDNINHIYFLVLNDNNFESINYTSYTEVEYDLINNKLIFECDYQKENIVLRRLQTCFTGFQFTMKDAIKTNIKASCLFTDITINPSALHFLFFNEDSITDIPILSTYFFIDESELTIADRENPIIKMRSVQEEISSDTVVGSDATIKLVQTNGNLFIEITKGKSEETIINLINLLARVLNYYDSKESDIQEALDYVVPGDEAKEKSGKKKRRQQRKFADVFEKKIEQLRNLSEDPDIFKPSSEGYSRRCNCQKQPIIIEEEEFEDWKNKTFIDKGVVQKRQIGNFPPNAEEPLFNYVCPDDELPYPTVIENNDPTLTAYTHLPCCAKTDAIGNPKSDYNTYGSVKTESGSGKSYKPKSKTLEWKRTGELLPSIEDILNANSIDKYKYDRFGVGDSLNSFIHCILIAKSVKKYKEPFKAGDYKECENICTEIRNSIPETMPYYFELTRQETFNETRETLLEGILDNNKFFNSSLYYRIFEEMYNVNIFVFENNGEFEIPNHSLVHIRPFDPERKCILLIKTAEIETEKSKYPVYDLIINTNRHREESEKSSNPFIFLHSKETSALIYTSFNKYYENYTFTISENTIENRFNPYSQINWPSIFEDVDIESQEIDSYGKLRSINIIFRNAGTQLTVCTPPGQPLNAPLTQNFYQMSSKYIEEIFGKPSIMTKNGVWYKILDYEAGIFIPSYNKNITNTMPLSPIIDQITKIDNPIYDYRAIKKQSKMLIDFIVWGLRSNKILNLKDYIKNKDKYIKVDKKVRPNISPLKLVSYITNKGDFSYLATIWPEYFYPDNTVKLYPELYEKVIGYLHRYYTITDGLNLPPDPFMKGIFEYEWDFKKFNQNRILISREHLNTWANIHQKNFKGDLQIYTDLKPDYLRGTQEPIIYHNKERQRMYLIQPVRDDNKERALSCAEGWKRDKFNRGYETPRNLFEDISYVVFTITQDYKITETGAGQLYGEDETDYVCILENNNKYYPLLEFF